MDMNVENNILELQNISFVYSGEKLPVWQGLNCYFKENTINLILGPSGCGKSTLLYLLNGTIPYSIEGNIGGKVLLSGVNVVGKEPKEMAQHIGMVFQDPDSQFCTFLVEDELAFGLENMCVPEKEIDEHIQMALEMVGMTQYRKHLLDELSGGQKQKIAIATVLAMKCDIIVMDEPTANLDAKSRSEIFILLETLIQDYGKTVILVEHNLDGVMENAGNIIVFDNTSKICLSGTSNEVIGKLMFDKKYQNVNVFLPEYLLILREWIYTNWNLNMVRGYCKKQVAYHNKITEKIFKLDVNAVVELLQGFSVQPITESSPKELDTNTVIKMKGLHFSYETRKKKKKKFIHISNNAILKDINLEIQQGEFVAIVGPNGVGKSTLLNVIFKVLDNYGGEASVLGFNLKNVEKYQLYAEFGLVFQNPEWQFITNDVSNELLFSLHKTKMDEEEKQKKVDNILERFHLTEQKGKSPFILSQGQKRRLSVATMLLTGQKVLFLDEPTYGQDYENQIELMNLLVELNQAGITIIMVTHNMSLVAEYSNKVILLVDGEIAFNGAPDILFKQKRMVEQGCLEIPKSYQFSKMLQEYLPDFPEVYSSQAFVKYLNAITEQGGT